MNAPRKLAVLVLLSFVCSSALAATSEHIVWQVNAARAIAISSDAQLMLTGLQLRHTSDGSLIRTFQTGYSPSGVAAAAFSPDNKLAALGIQAFNRNLFLFRVSDGYRLAGQITAHNNGTTCVAFSPDGQYLATGGMDGTVKLWRTADMALIRTINGGAGYRARVLALVYAKDGASVVAGGQGGVLQFRVSDGALIRQLTTVSTRSLALSPDGSIIASGSNEIDQYGQCADCSIQGWRMTDGAWVGMIPGTNNGVVSLAFSPDAHEIAAGTGDRTYGGAVRIYSTSTGQTLATWLQESSNGGSAYVTSLVYAPFGNLLALARADLQVITALDPF